MSTPTQIGTNNPEPGLRVVQGDADGFALNPGRQPDLSKMPSSTGSLFAFVLLVAVELSFVFGLLVVKKCTTGEAIWITAATTAIAAAAFYARGAIVTIGRRLISSTSM
jgi:hypothetical protein